MSDVSLPDGWSVGSGAAGHTVATKWFGDHYKTVEVPDDNDLAAAVAAVEQEADLRAKVSDTTDVPAAAAAPVADVPAEPVSVPDVAPAVDAEPVKSETDTDHEIAAELRAEADKLDPPAN